MWSLCISGTAILGTLYRILVPIPQESEKCAKKTKVTKGTHMLYPRAKCVWLFGEFYFFTFKLALT